MLRLGDNAEICRLTVTSRGNGLNGITIFTGTIPGVHLQLVSELSAQRLLGIEGPGLGERATLDWPSRLHLPAQENAPVRIHAHSPRDVDPPEVDWGGIDSLPGKK